MSKHPIVHIEFSARDLAESANFYSEAFGWKTQSMPEFDYVTFQAAGGPGGGFTRVGEQVRPGAVFVYIQTDDIEASLAKIADLGGKVVQPKTEIPGVGWFAYFQDPGGNVVALFTALIRTKTELVADIDAHWTVLNGTLDRLAETDMTAQQDAQGWTVKDHVSHLTAWERSARYFIQGKPRYQALGVDERLFLEGDEDKINAAIQERQRDTPVARVLDEFRQEHRQLMALLESLNDDDLQKTERDFYPDSPSQAAERTAISVIYSNTAHHYQEHQRWLEALITGAHE